MIRKLSLFLTVFFVALTIAGCNIPQVAIESTAAPATATEIYQPTVVGTATSSFLPLDNMLYLGTLDGQDAIFITNKTSQHYNEGETEGNSLTAGVVTLSTNEQRESFEFENLKNPQLLFTLPDDIFVTNFTIDGSRERLFVSLISRFSNDIYRFIPSTHDYQKIRSNEMNQSRYKSHRGIAVFKQVAGNYLVLAITPCYGCDGTTVPPIMVVLNISTGAEKALEGVGNISVNAGVTKVFYQKLEETKTACDPSPGCNDGYFSTYAPAGDVLQESLP